MNKINLPLNCLIVSLSLLFCFFSINAQNTVTRYTMDDGLPNSVVLDIAKDRDGFIWVHTFGGVCRFDGYDFKNYKVTIGGEERAFPSIGKFMTDTKKNLWISSYNLDSTIFRYNIENDNLELCAKEYNDLDLYDRDYLFTSDNRLLCWSDSVLYFSELVNNRFQTTGRYALDYSLAGSRMMDQLPDGSLWLLMRSGLYLMDTINEKLRLKEYSLVSEGSIDEKQKLYRILHTGSQLFILLNHSVFYTDLSKIDHQNRRIIGKRISFTSLSAGKEISQLLSMVYDGTDRLFLRAVEGVFSFSLSTQTSRWLYSEQIAVNDAGQGIFSQAIFYDDNILWIGSDQGLVKINVPVNPFHLVHPLHQLGKSESRLKCNSLLMDNQNRIWIGTVGDGLYVSEPDTGQGYTGFRHYIHDAENAFSLSRNGVGRMLQSESGNIYLSTNRIQIAREEKDRIRFETVEGSGFIGQITEGAGGRIYFFMYSSVVNQPYYSFCYYERTGKYLPIQAVMERDTTDIVYIAKTDDGSEYFLAGNKLNRVEGPFTYYKRGKDTLLLIEKYKTLIDPGIAWDTHRCLLNSNDTLKTLWFYDQKNEIIAKMPFSDHLNDPTEPLDSSAFFQEGTFYNINTQLTGAYVFDIINDDKGRLWCSTQNGITCLGPGKNDVRNFYAEDGIPVEQFYWGTDRDDHGNIYFCTIDGVLQFHPDSLLSEPPPNTYLTGIRVFNEAVKAGKSAFLNRSVSRTEQIKLPYNKNFLSFEYAALDYSNTQKVKYKYKMEGLDPEWVDAGDRRLADYPNLSPGRYKFRVIAANSSGIWNHDGASLGIRIMPPLWLRWWALAIEAILLTILLILYIRYRERSLKKQAVLLQQQVDEKTREVLEQRKEVDELKSRFYTNISHEFRTPLTLLLGPIEDSLKSAKNKVSLDKRILKVMAQNARRLQRLINQLLDISKIESGKMQLNLMKGDLSRFTNVLASSFSSLAESKNIDFKLDIQEFDRPVCFDSEKLDQVVTNLLSNAFKFTAEGGKISMSLKETVCEENKDLPAAEIIVSDTGVGISPEQIEKIFERFYQASDSETRESEGSGIGLSITRELVELMHGKISVNSEPGKGTSFRVCFPITEKCYTKEEIKRIQEGMTLPQEPWTAEWNSQPPVIQSTDDTNKELVLVVEDNPDLQSYIADKLKKNFRIITAVNGKTGLEKALEEVPDLVITDLMMPVMGGLDLCREIKKHPATDHIPVIMLTAKADKKSTMEGLELAADDYITKPFDAEILLARIKNLIHQRKELRKKFGKDYLLTENIPESSSPYFSFLKNIMGMIDKNLQDPDYTAYTLASDLGISRVQLYRKSTSLTGKNPGELIRLTKMKKAAQLLRKKDLNITQVMYEVGLQSLSNFSRVFKKYYGVTPTDYRKK